jgi:hypothetical protein
VIRNSQPQPQTTFLILMGERREEREGVGHTGKWASRQAGTQIIESGKERDRDTERKRDRETEPTIHITSKLPRRSTSPKYFPSRPTFPLIVTFCVKFPPPPTLTHTPYPIFFRGNFLI